MSKMLVLNIFVFVSAWSHIHCENCDQLGTLLYEDIGCKPKGVQNGCPTYFECDDFTMSKTSCRYKGDEITVAGEHHDNALFADCSLCRCAFDEEKKIAAFNCTDIHCTNTDSMPDNCYLRFKLGNCCPVEQKCPPFHNISTCIVEGQLYNEGEQFSPSDSCLDCVCQEGFQGKFEAPFCKRRQCGEQTRAAEELAKNCAPAYFGKLPCCPQKWACPSSTDKINRIPTGSPENSSLSCKWGDQTIKIGESVETKVEYYDYIKNVVCECSLPPLLTCKEAKK